MADETGTRAEYQDKARIALDKLKTQIDELRVQADLAKQVEQVVDDLGDTFAKLAGEVQAAVGAAGSAATKGRDAFLDEWKKARTEREQLLED